MIEFSVFLSYSLLLIDYLWPIEVNNNTLVYTKVIHTYPITILETTRMNFVRQQTDVFNNRTQSNKAFIFMSILFQKKQKTTCLF